MRFGFCSKRRRSHRHSRLHAQELLVEVLEDRRPLSFLPGVDYAAGSGPSAVAGGDFNGDGTPDLVVANYNSRSVSVLLGNGDGTFQAARSYACGRAASAVAVADFRSYFKNSATYNKRRQTSSIGGASCQVLSFPMNCGK